MIVREFINGKKSAGTNLFILFWVFFVKIYYGLYRLQINEINF
jgi:hypothetical protein